MRFAASEISRKTINSFTGKVHSVFRSTVNLILNDGELITLRASNDKQQLPGAISFSAPLGFDFSHHVKHGTNICCRGGILRLSESDLTFDLRLAQNIKLEKNYYSSVNTNIKNDESWQIAWNFLINNRGSAGLILAINKIEPVTPFDVALVSRAQECIPLLLSAVRKNNIVITKKAASRLVGAGPGLTPSGDDFLVGFLTGAQHTFQNKEQIKCINFLGSYLSKQVGNSVDISCAYLKHAASGYTIKSLKDLTKLIINDTYRTKIINSINIVLRFGHSSGSDTVFGLLCGLAVKKPVLSNIIIDTLNNKAAKVKYI